jgi:hypothetical protein
LYNILFVVLHFGFGFNFPFRYGDIEDKKKVLVYIKKVAKKVVKSEEMEVFAKNNPKLMIEIVEAMAE